MKKNVKIILVTLLAAVTVFCSACGNRNWFSDGFKNEIYYALIHEIGDKPILHEIARWSDSESESATIETKCCENYIWFSANNATLYKKIPSHLSAGDYIVCGQKN